MLGALCSTVWLPRQVRQGLHAFGTVNVEVTGLVLSQIDHRRMQGYGDDYTAYSKGYYEN